MRGGHKDTIRLGLVNVPVQMPTATERATETKTEQVAPSGQKAKQVYVDPAAGDPVAERARELVAALAEGQVRAVKRAAKELARALDEEGPFRYKVLAKDDLRRGVPTGDGYGIIDAEDWEAITEATKLEGVEIHGFCPAAALEERRERVRDQHFVQAQPGAATALGLLRAAMLAEGKVAEVTFSVGSRPRLGVMRVRDDGAMEVLTMRSEAEVREPDAEVMAAAEAEVPERLLDQALQLVGAMGSDGSFLDGWRDEMAEHRNALIERTLAGEAPERAAPARAPDVAGDLMGQLEASVKARPKRRAKAAR